MVRSCCVKVCNSELHDRKGQKLTTKNDILGLTLEKKTKQQEASGGLGCSSDTQNHHICQHISVYVRLPSTFSLKAGGDGRLHTEGWRRRSATLKAGGNGRLHTEGWRRWSATH